MKKLNFFKNKGFIWILILPVTILLIIGLTLYSYFISNWSLWVTIYLGLISCVAMFTARQSLIIQSSLVWEIEDLNYDEVNELAVLVVQDFGFYLLVHGIFISFIYWPLYYLSNIVF